MAAPLTVPVLVRYRSERGCVAALLVARDRRGYRAVWCDPAYRLHRIPLADARHCQPLPYDVRRAARSMLRAGRGAGITPGARAALAAALRHTDPRSTP